MISRIIKVQINYSDSCKAIEILLCKYYVLVNLVKDVNNIYWRHGLIGGYYSSNLKALCDKVDEKYIGTRYPNKLTDKDFMFFDFKESDI